MGTKVSVSAKFIFSAVERRNFFFPEKNDKGEGTESLICRLDVKFLCS